MPACRPRKARFATWCRPAKITRRSYRISRSARSVAGRLAYGLRSHVEQRIAAGRKDARTLNTLLGDWYISLRKACQGTALEPLLQVIIDVAAEKSECVLGMDSAKAIAQDVTKFVRAADAAKSIGVSVSVCMMRCITANAHIAHGVWVLVARYMKFPARRLNAFSSSAQNGFLTLRPASWQVSHPWCWSA